MVYRGGLGDGVLVVSVRYKPVTRKKSPDVFLIVMVVIVVVTDIGGSAGLPVAMKSQHSQLKLLQYMMQMLGLGR